MRGKLVLALCLTAALPLSGAAQDLAPDARPVVMGEGDTAKEPVLSPPHRITVPNADEIEQVAIMTIDQERLFLSSDWGQRVQRDLEAMGQALADENDRLADQFSQEEQTLTALRETLSPQDFRARADDFDKRVVEVRRERDSKSRDLQQRADQERTAFLQAALPILSKLMQERGAVVVLDQRMIFVSADKIDMTQELILRINQEVGAGASPEDQPAAVKTSVESDKDSDAAPAAETPEISP